jgi:hypothetical protein
VHLSVHIGIGEFSAALRPTAIPAPDLDRGQKNGARQGAVSENFRNNSKAYWALLSFFMVSPAFVSDFMVSGAFMSDFIVSAGAFVSDFMLDVGGAAPTFSVLPPTFIAIGISLPSFTW